MATRREPKAESSSAESAATPASAGYLFQTQRGHELIFHNGYEYRPKALSADGTTQFWTCLKSRCAARAHSAAGSLNLIVRSEHNHERVDAAHQMRLLKIQIKAAASADPTIPPAELIAAHTQGLTAAQRSKFSYKGTQRSVERHRRRVEQEKQRGGESEEPIDVVGMSAPVDELTRIQNRVAAAQRKRAEAAHSDEPKAKRPRRQVPPPPRRYEWSEEREQSPDVQLIPLGPKRSAPKWACPAMLNVTPYNGKFLISGCTTHSGHDHPADSTAAAPTRHSPSPNFPSSSAASATVFPIGAADLTGDTEDSSTRSMKALLGELSRADERPTSTPSSTHDDFGEQRDFGAVSEDGFSALERLFESTEASGQPFSELIPSTAAAANPMSSSFASSSKSPSVSPPAPPVGRKSGGKRDDYLSWDEFFMGTALLASQRSKDPNTQVGAVIVGDDNVILSIGYNGMPRGCSDDQLPWGKGADDPLSNKYLYVCHAEMNAVINKNTASLRKATIYTTLFPCNECAKIIIQAGITTVVYLHDKPDKMEMKASRILFDMTGIEYRQFRAGHNGIQLRFQ